MAATTTRLGGPLALLALAGLATCDDATPGTSAREVSTRTELIGGPSALGELGDWVLENDKIRIVIQDVGFSRGFGVYGGSLIDADLVRPLRPGQAHGGHGRDQFGELFPIFFIEALEPQSVEVVDPGGDGATARVRVRGTGADFLSLTKAINRAIVNSHELPVNPLELLEPQKLEGDPQIEFQVDYALEPGSRAVEIATTLRNLTERPLPIPSQTATTLLGTLLGDLENFDVPLGFVALCGAGNRIFAPGYGYDIRFALDDSREVEGLSFPALPGLLVPGLLSTSSNGVSYGLFSDPKAGVEGFVAGRVNAAGENIYEKAYDTTVDEDTMLVPFIASAFTGVFYAQPPNELAAAGEDGDEFTYHNIFVVGDGDAGSIFDELYRLRGVETGKLEGRVRDALSLAAVDRASVLVYRDGSIVNQFYTNADGVFLGRLAPGDYTARVQHDPVLSDPVPFTVKKSKGTYIELAKPASARIVVSVRDGAGRPLPAKATVVGRYDPAHAGKLGRRFLFDLAAGEHWRTTDMVPDDPDKPETLRYIETFGFTEGGRVELEVPAGHTWDVVVSRGIEYSVEKFTVSPKAGQVEVLGAELSRVVDTSGHISADFHLHQAPSLDSSISLHDRVSSGAAEGVEYLVATDHNFITDFKPAIEQAGLQDWLGSMIGLELTTLESGHFNGFPMKRDAGLITKGSFEWSLRPPQYIFDELRRLGSLGPDKTIVQINHARDSILGYFAQYGLTALGGDVPPPAAPVGLDFSRVISPSGPAFFECDRDEDGNIGDCASTYSADFDALEVLNAGLLNQIHHARMPKSVEGLEIPDETKSDLPPEGSILCEDGDVAFPGAVDDWFNLLNRGDRYTGLANSDAHGRSEIGYPRTYLRLGKDHPGRVTDLEVVDAVQGFRAIMTNGPFVELFVNGQPIGSELSDTDGEVEVRVEVRAAPWVDIARGRIVVNGETVETFDIGDDARGAFEVTRTVALPRDAWIVAEITGDESMFPVAEPYEVPPLLINDAFASIAGPLGFGSSVFGELEPTRTGPIKPLALTNPIWVDVDGGGFEAPGPISRACVGLGVQRVDADAFETRAFERTRPPVEPGKTARDVQWIFRHFAGHAHH